MNHERPSAEPDDEVLRLSRESRGTTAILHASGEIDMATAPLLTDALTGYEATPLPERMVLDLGAITFMSSAGLMILNTHHRRFTELGVEFVVVADQQAVVRILALTGISDLVKLVPDLEAAVAP